jgi:diacylglycerol kinase (ATP)
MPHRIRLIFNPHADRGRAWKLANLLQSLFERLGNASWASSEYPGHSTQLAVEAAKEGVEVVAALGGDGTVHEVVNGLMQFDRSKRPLLGIIPLGSGNDFASTIGVENEPEKSAIRLYQGVQKQVDIGVVTDETGKKEFWDNTIGVGFDASATIHARQITRLQGFPMYLWAVIRTILRNHDSAHMTIETETEMYEGEMIMVAFCNGPREGGGFHVAPDAVTDDGVLNFAYIEKVSRLMMFRILPEVMRGTHERFRQVRLGEARKTILKFDRPMAIHTDGEIFAGFQSNVRQLTIEVLPQELDILV